MELVKTSVWSVGERRVAVLVGRRQDRRGRARYEAVLVWGEGDRVAVDGASIDEVERRALALLPAVEESRRLTARCA